MIVSNHKEIKFIKNDKSFKSLRRKLRKNQTDAEKELWAHLCNRQFHGLRFLRQYSVGHYILDFYCPYMKVAIELDGGQHNDTIGKADDVIRTGYLKTQGIDVIRFWNNDVLMNIQGVLTKIEELCNPSPPPLRNKGRRRYLP
jgi:very-short-patch-repair endonuclease